jgi:deoxyadenosine/deoxycytidine kinase
MEEERTKEVIHSISYLEENIEEDVSSSNLEGIDLDDSRAVADYYMAKNNLIDADQILIEKKEKELKEDITEVVQDKDSLIEYLTNLHASIEVMEERIYELELKLEKLEKKENDTLIPKRPLNPGMSGRGIGQLPFGIF